MALSIFPLLSVLPLNWVEVSWGFHYGRSPMPVEICAKAEKVGRYVLWFRHGLALTLVMAFAGHYGLRFQRIGLTLQAWRPNILIGIVACCVALVFQKLFGKDLPQIDMNTGPPAAEPAVGWITSQMFSVLAEESWLALCAVCFIQTGWSIATAILVPATVFGALHYRYRAGAITTGVYGAISLSLFLWRGSILPPFLLHYGRNMGTLYWARRRAALTRR